MRVAVAACLAVSCGQSQGIADRDLGGLVEAEKRATEKVDLDRVGSDPNALGKALMRPHHEARAALGAFSVSIVMTTRVSENGKVQSELDEKALLESATDGAYYGVYTNSQDYGREVIFVGGKLYLRPRYQRWHARDPSRPDEPVEMADMFYAPIAATWELFAPGVALADKGTAQVAGRQGRLVSVSRASSPRRAAPESLPQRKWRERRTVDAIAGTAILDAQHGVPLALNLTGTIGFQRDNRQFTMQVSIHSEVTNIGQPAPIAPPPDAEVVATPERLREVDDRDFLLQGIAPPVRKAESGAQDKPRTTAEKGTLP